MKELDKYNMEKSYVKILYTGVYTRIYNLHPDQQQPYSASVSTGSSPGNRSFLQQLKILL